MPDAHDTETLAEVLAKSLAEHEVNLRFLWRDLADKDIEHGVDWPGVVRTLFADMDRIVQARAGEGALRARIEAVLAEPDDTQWWPVQPYMDPHDEDEVVEVQVIDVARVRAALTDTAGDPS